MAYAKRAISMAYGVRTISIAVGMTKSHAMMSHDLDNTILSSSVHISTICFLVQSEAF